LHRGRAQAVEPTCRGHRRWPRHAAPPRPGAYSRVQDGGGARQEPLLVVLALLVGAALAADDATRDGGAVRDGLVRVDPLVELLAVE